MGDLDGVEGVEFEFEGDGLAVDIVLVAFLTLFSPSCIRAPARCAKAIEIRSRIREAKSRGERRKIPETLLNVLDQLFGVRSAPCLFEIELQPHRLE